jgi:hypothetical protein
MTADEYETQVQKIIDEYASFYNTSY